jgi:hypothetical protein
VTGGTGTGGAGGLARILSSSSESRLTGPRIRFSDISNIYSNLPFNSEAMLLDMFSTLCISFLEDWTVWDKCRSSSRRCVLPCTNTSNFLFCAAWRFWDKFRILSRRSLLSCANSSSFLSCATTVLVSVSIIAWRRELSNASVEG